MKKIFLIWFLLVLGGCWINSLSNSSSTDSQKPIMRYLWTWNENIWVRRNSFWSGKNLSWVNSQHWSWFNNRERNKFGSGDSLSWFNRQNWSWFNMQERINSFATWDRDLFQKMQEYRQSWNLSWADEIRAQLKAKYPDMFNCPQRNSN